MKKKIVILSLLIIFILSRVIFLDSDLPSFDIFNYQPIDEFWYNNAAFNLFHYKDIQHKILPFIESDSISSNIFQNLFTFCTLFIFGNNYYGLRMASVIASLGVFVFFYYTLQNYVFNNQKENVWKLSRSKFVVIACMVYITFDFPFLLASRISEPTIFRMLFLLALMYYFTTSFAHKNFTFLWFTLLSGFIAFASVLFVYPTNAFLVPSIYGICIYANWGFNYKKLIFHTFIFIVGGIICMVSYELTLNLFFGKTWIDQLVVYSGFVDRINIPISPNAIEQGLLKKSLTNIFGIFSTNIFRFNPILLIIWLATLPIVFLKLFKKRSINEAFLLLILIFFFLQLIFLNDYFYRKLVLLLPLVLITISVGINYILFNIHNIKIINNRKIYFIFIIMFVILIFLMNCVPKYIGKDVLTDQKYILAPALAAQLCFFIFLRKSMNMHSFFYIMLFLLITPSLYLSGRYIFLNPTFTYKNTMAALSLYSNDKLMVGGMSTSFRLYNSYIPILDCYGYKNTKIGRSKYAFLLNRALLEKGEKYSILYQSSGNSLFHADNIVYNGKIKLLMTLDLDKNSGSSDSIGLYRYINNH